MKFADDKFDHDTKFSMYQSNEAGGRGRPEGRTSVRPQRQRHVRFPSRTRCRKRHLQFAWLAGAGGEVLGRGTAGPSNAKAVGMRRAAARECGAAILCRIGRRRARAGPGGCGLPRAGGLRPARLPRRPLAGWADEARLAARAGAGQRRRPRGRGRDPQGWGVGVIAGTGSIAVGLCRMAAPLLRRRLGAPDRRHEGSG